MSIVANLGLQTDAVVESAPSRCRILTSYNSTLSLTVIRTMQKLHGPPRRGRGVARGRMVTYRSEDPHTAPETSADRF